MNTWKTPFCANRSCHADEAVAILEARSDIALLLTTSICAAAWMG